MFKFISARSGGVSKRQQAGCERQPVIDDLHVASLYSDKVLAERVQARLRSENLSLLDRCTRAESALHTALLNTEQAWGLVTGLDQKVVEADQFRKESSKRKKAEQTATKARREVKVAESALADSLEVAKVALRAEKVAQRGELEVRALVAATLSQRDALAKRAEHSKLTVQELSLKSAEVEKALLATGRSVICRSDLPPLLPSPLLLPPR